MSIAVEHGRFILTAINESERILLPTASRCKRDVFKVREGLGTAWAIFAARQARLLSRGGRS
jgi:hypothetical protein